MVLLCWATSRKNIFKLYLAVKRHWHLQRSLQELYPSLVGLDNSLERLSLPVKSKIRTVLANNVYNILLFALGLSFALFSDPVLHFRRESGEKKRGLIYRTVKLLTLKATVDKVLLVSDKDWRISPVEVVPVKTNSSAGLQLPESIRITCYNNHGDTLRDFIRRSPWSAI